MIEPAPGELENLLIEWLKLTQKRARISLQIKNLELEREELRIKVVGVLPTIAKHILFDVKKFVVLRGLLFEIKRTREKGATVETHEVVGNA